MNAKLLLEALHEFFPLDELVVVREGQRLRITHSLTLVDDSLTANVWAKTPQGVLNFSCTFNHNPVVPQSGTDRIIADTICSELASNIQQERERQDAGQNKLAFYDGIGTG